MRSHPGRTQRAGHRRHQGSGDPGPRAAQRRAGPGAYVRLLDSTGEFTAEVPTSATGHFRFFAGDGSWTLRTLAPGAQTDRQVVAARGNVLEVDVLLDAVAA